MGNPSDFANCLDKATLHTNTEPKWGFIMEVCDMITENNISTNEALKQIKKKMNDTDPHVSIQALQVLDACVSNCGEPFHLAVCSRDMSKEIRQIIKKKSEPKLSEQMYKFLTRWVNQEFASNPQFSLMRDLKREMDREGFNFSGIGSVNETARKVSPIDEDEQFKQAIKLSLQESKSKSSSTSAASSSTLYPSFNSTILNSSSNSTTSKVKEPYKVRALYDFEAAEDNEITFKAGEILLVLDDSDVNWWKGSNHRGEGLFPSNFVTKNLDEMPEPLFKGDKKSVQFNDQVKVKLLSEEVTKIEETKIDRLQYLLNEADTTGEKADTEELLQLEEQCTKMGPLIDKELERVDKQHTSLAALNAQLNEALNLYCSLMKESSTVPVQQANPNAYFQYGAVAHPPVPPNNYATYSVDPAIQMAQPTQNGYCQVYQPAIPQSYHHVTAQGYDQQAYTEAANQIVYAPAHQQPQMPSSSQPTQYIPANHPSNA